MTAVLDSGEEEREEKMYTISGSKLIVTAVLDSGEEEREEKMYTISGSNLIVTAVLDSGEEEREEEEEEEKGRGGGDEEEMEGEGVYMLGGGSTSSGLKVRNEDKRKIHKKILKKSVNFKSSMKLFVVLGKAEKNHLTA